MKLTLTETRYLKDSISIISDLVNEATFKVTPQAIELVAMDPANVAMVIFKLLSSCFTAYEIKEKVELAINLNNLKQILRRIKPEDVLYLEVESNKLKVTLQGTTRRTFSIPILDMDEKEQRVPDLNFGATVKTNAGLIADAIEDVGIVGESVSFTANPERLMISAEGDLSKAHIDIEKGGHTQINVHDGSTLRSKYSIEYLKKMIAGGKLADDVVISFNKDYPLRMDFKAIDKVALSFILAPRVEND